MAKEGGSTKTPKKDKLLTNPLFWDPSNDAFLLVVSETMNPPSFCNTHTQPTPTQPPNTLQPLLSAIVPIPVSPDLLHTPLHMDKWLGLAWPD